MTRTRPTRFTIPRAPQLTRTGSRPGERGAALITVMLVMFALLGLGMTAMWMTSGNLQISATTNLRNQALYVAEAGIEAVRGDLNGPTPRDISALLTGGSDATFDNPPTAPGVDANGQPNGIGAVYVFADNTRLRDVAFPPASFNRGAGATSDAPLSTTMGSYTVWIRNDTGELRQGKITTDTNGSVVVRSRGVAVDGRTEVILEVTLGGSSTPGSPITACNSGKNACDENSSTLSGIFVE
jgi:hypothetical protein